MHNNHGVGGEPRGVIRLSYYGGGHYDSIHKFGTFNQNNQEKVNNKYCLNMFFTLYLN